MAREASITLTPRPVPGSETHPRSQDEVGESASTDGIDENERSTVTDHFNDELLVTLPVLAEVDEDAAASQLQREDAGFRLRANEDKGQVRETRSAGSTASKRADTTNDSIAHMLNASALTNPSVVPKAYRAPTGDLQGDHGKVRPEDLVGVKLSTIVPGNLKATKLVSKGSAASSNTPPSSATLAQTSSNKLARPRHIYQPIPSPKMSTPRLRRNHAPPTETGTSHPDLPFAIRKAKGRIIEGEDDQPTARGDGSTTRGKRSLSETLFGEDDHGSDEAEDEWVSEREAKRQKSADLPPSSNTRSQRGQASQMDRVTRSKPKISSPQEATSERSVVSQKRPGAQGQGDFRGRKVPSASGTTDKGSPLNGKLNGDKAGSFDGPSTRTRQKMAPLSRTEAGNEAEEEVGSMGGEEGESDDDQDHPTTRPSPSIEEKVLLRRQQESERGQGRSFKSLKEAPDQNRRRDGREGHTPQGVNREAIAGGSDAAGTAEQSPPVRKSPRNLTSRALTQDSLRRRTTQQDDSEQAPTRGSRDHGHSGHAEEPPSNHPSDDDDQVVQRSVARTARNTTQDRTKGRGNQQQHKSSAQPSPVSRKSAAPETDLDDNAGEPTDNEEAESSPQQPPDVSAERHEIGTASDHPVANADKAGRTNSNGESRAGSLSSGTRQASAGGRGGQNLELRKQWELLDDMQRAVKALGVSKAGETIKRLDISEACPLQTFQVKKLVKSVNKAREICRTSNDRTGSERPSSRLKTSFEQIQDAIETLTNFDMAKEEASEKAIEEIYAHGIPGLVKLLYVAFKLQVQEDYIDDESLEHFLEILALTQSLGKVANAWKKRPRSHLSLVKPTRNKIFPALRELRRSLRKESRERAVRASKQRDAEELEELEEMMIEGKRAAEEENRRQITARRREIVKCLAQVKQRTAPRIGERFYRHDRASRPEVVMSGARARPPPVERGRQAEPTEWTQEEIAALFQGLEQFTSHDRYARILHHSGRAGQPLENRDLDEVFKKAKEMRNDLVADVENHPGLLPAWIQSI